VSPRWTAEVGAVVGHLHDIGALLGDQSGEAVSILPGDRREGCAAGPACRLFTKPRSMMRDSSVTSMLPPQISHHDFLVAKAWSFFVSMAAMPAAPRAFGRASSSFFEQPEDRHGDFLFLHGPRFRRHIFQTEDRSVRQPGATAMPSAMVDAAGTRTG